MLKKSFLLVLSVWICISPSTNAATGHWDCVEASGHFFLRSSRTFSDQYPYDIVSTSPSLPSGCVAYITRAGGRRVLAAQCDYSVMSTRIMQLPGYWRPDGNSLVESFCYTNGDCYSSDLYWWSGCKTCCTFVPDKEDDDDEDDDDDKCPDLNLTIRGTLLPARRGTARVSGDWCN